MKYGNGMNRGRETWLSDEDQRRYELVERIVSSDTFSRALQLREILLYITQQYFLGTKQIKEQDIASGALGRSANFDGSQDNIVRVQVGHLRKKLEQYFAIEGQSEPVVVVIPKGTYSPQFETKSSTASAIPTNSETPITLSRRLRDLRLWAIVASALLLCFVISSVRLSWQLARRPSTGNPTVSSAVAADQNIILRYVFAHGVSVSIVTSDTNLVLMQNTLHTDISANEYAAKDYPENILASNPGALSKNVVDQLPWGRYTSFGDAEIAVHCSELAQKSGSLAVVRYARFINIRDFDQGNFVLIGSRRGNPWVSLFEPKLNFVFEEDPVTHVSYFQNRVPEPGEPSRYLTASNGKYESTSYALIALVPNLATTGYVLLLDGATMEDTEAAAEFLLGPQNNHTIAKALGTKPPGEEETLEILLRVNVIQGVAKGMSIAAVRRAHT